MASGPREMQPRRDISASLQHHKSTKQLISRYESISSPGTRAAVGSAPKKSRKVSSSKKDKSPIRESFRNLLSVFKKGRGSDEPVAGKVLVGTLERYSKHHCHSAESTDYSLLCPPPQDPEPLFMDTAITPLYCNDFYYLCRSPSRSNAHSPSRPILPVWMSCSAELQAESICVTLTSSEGNPSFQTVSLACCTDVRSAALTNLTAEEISLLPTVFESQDYKVFEVIFEGKPREKFAASSVQERARWVSAIWDVVIANQERNSKLSTYSLQPRQIPRVAQDSLTSPLSYEHSTSYDRKLPAIPPETPAVPPGMLSPPKYSLQSSSVYSSPPSSLPPTPGQRFKSPSVAHLSQRSVVKQRLAEIERTSSGGGSSNNSRLSTPPALSRFSRSGSSRSAPSTRLTTPQTSEDGGSKYAARVNQSKATSGALFVADCSSLPQAPQHHGLTRYHLKDEPVSAISGARTLSEAQRDVASPSKDSHITIPQSALSSDTEKLLTVLLQRYHTDQHDHLSEVHRDILNVLPTIAALLEGQSQGPQLESIHHTLLYLHQQAEGNKTDLVGLRDLLTQLTDNTEQNVVSGAIVARNLGSTSLPQDETLAQNISQVNSKLDALSSVIATSCENDATKVIYNPELMDRLMEQLKAISSRLENDNAQQDFQFAQQADNVRYLNQLNGWLEAFVNNGTSQISSIAANVDNLSRQLGINTDNTLPPPPQDITASVLQNLPDGQPGPHQTNLLADIRQTLANIQAREQNVGALQDVVNALAAQFNEHTASKSEFTPETVMGLLDRQRYDQEGLLRDLTTELSNEIHGERLRFVEAMKEATAINVQVHVEQFKKELTKEVISMTKEVGRLHQEKQSVEAQIADLFSFYQKQKASFDANSSTPAPGYAPQQQHMRAQQRQFQQHPAQAAASIRTHSLSGRSVYQQRPLPSLQPYRQL